jgi:anti-sigma factor RsiW
MHNDNQHLDFLISQHVDGCLDAAGKKSLEQRLMTDPDARKLYQEHRDVQDMLDDWGNRIPLINWDDFDKQLAGRLEKETVGAETRKPVRTWYKPVAAAAALFIAASLGYGWHALSSGTPAPGGATPQVATIEQQHTSVTIEGSTDTGNLRRFAINDGPSAAAGNDAVASVSVSAPGDAAASDSLRDAVLSGLANVTDTPSQQYNLQSKPSSVSAYDFNVKRGDDHIADRDGMPPLP